MSVFSEENESEAADSPIRTAQRNEAHHAAINCQGRMCDTPPNEHGVIVTPPQRCTHVNETDNTQCAVMTPFYHLCREHLASDQRLEIRQSNVGADAGYGLFAFSELPEGHRIPLTGDVMPLAPLKGEKGHQSAGVETLTGGPYVMTLRPGWGVDAARLNCEVGRWVNDPKGSGRQANCIFQVSPTKKVLFVETTRKILKNEELLVEYGGEYVWHDSHSSCS